MLTRRRMLASMAAVLASPTLRATADAAESPADSAAGLDVRDIEVAGDPALGRRFALVTPKGLAPGERVPLLVLLHGLAETADPRTGAFAWLERYGLADAYARLKRPPVARTSTRADWTDARVLAINADLAARPFRGFAIACPYTPNVWKAPSLGAALDGYAQWLTSVVIPRARSEAPILADAAHTSIDGCSLGGFVSLEVFLRAPEQFCAWGGVQSALSVSSADLLANRLARAIATAGARRLHIETSQGDPFRAANEALVAALRAKPIACDALVLPGPHDQPWLRESGTLEMLHWHDRLHEK